MKRLGPACLLLFIISPQFSVSAQGLQAPAPESARVETHNQSNKADFWIGLGAVVLRYVCDRSGRCPFTIVDKIPEAKTPVPIETPPDYRRQLNSNGSTAGTALTPLYQSFAQGETVAIGPKSQYSYNSGNGGYDLLNGVWAYPAKRSSTSLSSEIRQFENGIRKANTYITFEKSLHANLAGNSCMASNYSGINPRTTYLESGTAYVCQKGLYQLFFVTVASGPDRDRYRLENQLVIQKMTVQ